MQIVVIKKDKLFKYPFPNENINSYWITDYDEFGESRELISMERRANGWILLSNDICHIEKNNVKVKETTLTLNTFCNIKIKNRDESVTNAIIYVYRENDINFMTYQITKDGDYTIGRDKLQNIILSNDYINLEHAILSKINGKISIKSKDINSLIYINNIRMTNKALENGDIIFIFGYIFIVIDDYVLIDNYNNMLKICSDSIVKKGMPKFSGELTPTVDDDNAVLYNETDYYDRQPRFVTSIVEEDFRIDNPPGKTEEDDTPVLYTIGPMITMSLSSAVSASVSIINVINNKGSFFSIFPTLLISLGMVTSAILWPSLMKKYNKNKQRKKEEERRKKYSDYLDEKQKNIEVLKVSQNQILLEYYPEPKNIGTIIVNKKRHLWERQIDSEDFLRVRLGLGTIPLKIKLAYSKEEFSMVEDELKDKLNDIAENSKEINHAPVVIDLIERNKLVLIGEQSYKEAMLKCLILQLTTYQSYNDLKLVFMINDTTNKSLWESLKILPHTWSNARDIRFYANDYDEMSKISFYLEQVFTSRKYTEDDGNMVESDRDYRNFSPYYLIVVDNIKKNKNVEIISKVLDEGRNLGFGIIVLNDGISNLPNDFNNFLTAAGEKSAIIKNDLNTDNQQFFTMDAINDVDFPLMCEKLSNIPIKLPAMLDEMKASLGFLEMYKVGKIEQLNVLDRWVKNNPVNSLSVPIGIHTDGEIFNLDLHERFYGPHGLIAGMTGSGKSEFIITFILSMSLNFSPEEVSFVLIDYKGGGLTGAFENKMTNVRLPHLAGTITNLDNAEINRSLASIRSELKRRQELFNKARFELNESTIDIYKYQKLYRDGAIKEPISHLFIVSDEFAELKSQKPDFMDELISTARIGRSLGVHLILATQKPSGVVDDQIWSNSKFKICLKVQEKADSMEVIKCPDAANIKKVGRFYLQVGYNDYFAMGQAAYAGIKYIPKDKMSKVIDRKISFINNIGDTIKSYDTSIKKDSSLSLGEELPNIMNYICESAKMKNLFAKKLWLDKIPAEIFVNNLINKYLFSPQKWVMKAIVGEYDDPNSQSQGLLTIDFNSSGNTLVYGNSGKEIFISSILYSLIINHSSDEINIYILDFGTEMFGIFKNAPQVGDVMFVNDEEKVANLFNTVIDELERRKKIFTDYNGDYDLFINNSGKSLPKFLIIINNYESFAENFEKYVDVVSALTREAERYGIEFVITATGCSSVRGKTTQNFSNIFCLQFNNPSDYASLLGSTHGMIPSDILGRGLVKIDGSILEFQTAYPYKWNEISLFIKDICNKLNERITLRAKTIRILPDHVRITDVSNSISDLSSVPIGIVKESLDISTFNFNKNPISLIASQDITIMDNFISSLCQVIQSITDVELYVVDPNESIKEASNFKNHFNSSMSMDVLNKLDDAFKDNSSKKYVFMFYGIDAFKNKLTSDKQQYFKNSLVGLSTHQNVKIILADVSSKIKLFEFEDFYKQNVQAIYAIWMGSGITEQFTIKSSTFTRETRGMIENDFGYNVDRGNAKLVKLLDFYSKE